MEFIDKTGHIFSLPSYSDYPTGFEYEETPYIFWINETGKLSINNYYVKSIHVMLDNNKYGDNIDNLHLSIKLESTIFNLLGSNDINELLNKNKNLFDYININPDYFKGELTEEDVTVLTDIQTDNVKNTCSMFTFYIVAYDKNQETMLSNILIDIYNEETDEHDFCPVTIGGEFVDENEALIINGKNLGINLPKDILQAIYKSSFYNYVADEYTYNYKLKELLLNYMNIKGECGNYKSAIDSLKWFEWGDKLKIVKLLETDNNFISQYVFDKFDIKNDVITSYKLFRNTTYIKLFVKGSEETDKINEQNFDSEFWGEGKPIVKDLTNSNSYSLYDEGDIKFYKPYYDFLFDELGLKLAALEYYYKKYFLPIHLFIHNASIQYQCFTNDVKMMIGENKTILSEVPQLLCDINDKISVEFPSNNYVMITTQSHIIDDNYNEFNKYIVDNECEDNLYYINENCISIPINFKQEIDEQYYDCKLIFEKIEKTLYNYVYSFLYDFDYNEIFNLNITDGKSNITNSVLISHQLYKVNINEQRLEKTDKWSNYMSYEDTKKYIKDNYITPLTFNIDKLPVFSIKIQSINEIKQLKAGIYDYVKYSICEILDDNHEQIFESNFKFVQQKDNKNTYYKNFVIVPKIFGKKYGIDFLLNNEFNIYLLVNGQWHTYNFTCKVPEFQLEIGKLNYKYYLDASDTFINQYGDISMFNQLKSLSDDKVEFNRFMWQPDLVKVNNIDFFENLLDYYKDYKYNIVYDEDNLNIIEGDSSTYIIKLNDLYYILTIDNHKFYIHHDVISKYFIKEDNKSFDIPLELLDNDTSFISYNSNSNNIEFSAIYNESNNDKDIYNGSSGSQNIHEHENVLIVCEDNETLKFKTINNTIVDSNIYDLSNSDNYLLVYENEGVSDTNNLSLRIFFELDDNNCIHFYIKDIYNNNIYLDVKKTIYKNIYTLLDKYKEFPNIVNNDKYLNKVHLFDIYKNGELIKYEKLTNKAEAELYKIFFNSDCSSKINIEGYENVYDFYLMHNESQWYSLFISKLTENIYNKNLLYIPNKVIEYYDIRKEYVIQNINDIIINKVLIENALTEDDINCEYYSNGLIINIYRRHKNTLLYSIKDDVNYHKETVEEYDKYTFSMNNTLYYINGKKNEETGNIEYFVDYNNEKVDIESETYEYDENDLIYDEERYTYIGKLYNEETGEYSYYDYIPGLKHEKYYYTYLSNIKVYSDIINIKDVSHINDFYVFYDGEKLYNKEWYLIINVYSSLTNVKDIIKFYKKDDNTELKWEKNPKYDYETEKYVYYKDSDTIIESFDNIYVDSNGYFFELVRDSNNQWFKSIIYRKLKDGIIEKYSLYDMNTGKYYNEDEITDEYEVILNTEDNDNVIEGRPDYDGLYYLYDKNNKTWTVLIYIGGATPNNIDIKWYYEINGSTYEYSGDIDLNNILDDNTIYVELVEPIKVYLNIIPGSEHKDAYYEIKDKYEFKFVKSDDKFLINRMQYESCNGNNHFNNDDIIVTTLSAKMNKTIDEKTIDFKTEFKLDNGTKWDFIPMSLKTSKTASVGSTTELAIMSIGDSNIKYERGYYDIICNYSLDGNIDHIYKKIARILVK